MKKRALIFFPVLLLAIAAGIFSLTDPEAEVPEKESSMQLKAVLLKNTDDINFILDFAREKGFFEKKGLEVADVRVEKDPFKLLMAGEGDVAFSGISTYLSMYLNGSDPKWIYSMVRPFGNFGISRFPEDQSDKIKKTVITNFGTEAHMQAIVAVKNRGLDYKKVEFFAAPRLSREELVKKGEADFALVRGFPDKAAFGDGFSFYSTEDLFKGVNFSKGLFTTEKNVEEKNRELEVFVATLKEAADYAKANEGEIVAFMEKSYGYSSANARLFFDQFLKASENLDNVPDISSIESLVDLVKSEFKPEQPDRDLSGFIHDEFAKKASNRGEK